MSRLIEAGWLGEVSGLLGRMFRSLGAAAGGELEEIQKFFKNLLTATQKAGHNLASLLLTTNESSERNEDESLSFDVL